MSYVKAQDIFPDRLLQEIQQYVQGEVIYIPNPKGIRKGWGENSGCREYLNHRNKTIRGKYAVGITIDKLAEEFCLSIESIKRIIYSK